MRRSLARTTSALFLALGVLLAAIAVEAGPPVDTDEPPRLYTVVIAAPDRDARTRRGADRHRHRRDRSPAR